MAVHEQLQPRSGHSWHRGLGPLLRKENRRWWGGRRWLVHALVWLLVVNGLLALILFVMPNMTTPDGEALVPGDLLNTGLQGFFSLGTMALAIGVIVLAQDTVIGEKQSGTAEWLLSKPISRPAFVLAKLLAHAGGILVIFVLLQSLVAYGQIAQVGPLAPLAFGRGVAVLALHTLFYLALTLMLGVLLENRSLVLGAPLALLLAGPLLPAIEPLMMVTPWSLGNIGLALAMGVSLPAELIVPLVATAGWLAIFIAVALWRFNRYEF
ncbi:MAG: ABC transporter permease subunit [Candidatus Promineifilaceae bacterium]|nr:ABC transporter permease subunit [Candidatus Promineifilaceae bacterium]